ncbi:hypothetical protein V8E54_003252 [Elaphomyces granulatus]
MAFLTTTAMNLFLLSIIPAIVFFESVVQLLYYAGVFQWCVPKFVVFFFWAMRMSGAEALHQTGRHHCRQCPCRIYHGQKQEMLTAGYVAVPAEDNNRPVNSLDCFARGAWLGFKIAGIIVAILCINGHLNEFVAYTTPLPATRSAASPILYRPAPRTLSALWRNTSGDATSAHFIITSGLQDSRFVQLMFHRSPCSTDSQCGRIPPPSLPAFAPLVLACQPAVSGSDEWKHGDIGTGTTGIIKHGS